MVCCLFIYFLSLSFSVCSAAAGIVRKKQWCEMVPCLEDEGCDLLVNKSGWTCTQPGGRVKTTTVSPASAARLHNPLAPAGKCAKKKLNPNQQNNNTLEDRRVPGKLDAALGKFPTTFNRTDSKEFKA